MRNRSNRIATASRMLEVKQRFRDASGYQPAAVPAIEEDESEVPPPPTCINCGYKQYHQPVDRCPECGLGLASKLQDPTSWASPGPRCRAWWGTAWKVWTWDKRIRTRTSIIPITAESRSFATWAIGISAAFCGLAIAILNLDVQSPAIVATSGFLLQYIFGAILSAVVLAVSIQAQCLLIRGCWRRRLRFVPASIHYATAWWPMLSLLFVVCAQPIHGVDAALKLLLMACGLWLWAFWLWASATESQHIRNVTPKIGALVIVTVAMGALPALFVPGASRIVVLQAIARADSGLTKLNAFQTVAGSATSRGPRTLAVVIDAIRGPDDAIVMAGIQQLGAPPADSVVIRDQECTLDQVSKAILAARNDLRPQDRFILYVNGHGSPHGSGSIQMADGEITSQRLSELLAYMPTSKCLVIVDSCFGGKFMPALRSSMDGIFITSTDNRNVGYTSGLSGFWQTLGSPQADRDGDGQTTIEEAFWCAFRPMLSQAEQVRQAGITKSTDKKTTGLLTVAGYATPQIFRCQKTDQDAFLVPVNRAER